jgi:cytochrome c biogenesis protein CcmG/thiol:disulfide interchange protein DsbE
MKKLKWIPLFLVLTAAASWSCQNAEQKPEAEARSQPVPELRDKEDASGIQLTLDSVDGTKISLSDYKGKVVLIDVWDTWCPPCKKGIPEFIELYKEYKDKGVVILGIAGGRYGLDAVKQFVKEYGINYPIAMISQEVLETLGNIQSIPTAFLLDRDHKIVNKYVGYRSKSVFATDLEKVT